MIEHSNRNGAPSAGTACSLELSLLSPAGIWFKTLLPVGGANTALLTLTHKGEVVSQHPSVDWLRLQGFRGWECGGRRQSEDCGIPTKPVGGLLSDIGKVAPVHGRTGAPYRTTLKWFYVPPWAPAVHPSQAQANATISTVQ